MTQRVAELAAENRFGAGIVGVPVAVASIEVRIRVIRGRIEVICVGAAESALATFQDVTFALAKAEAMRGHAIADTAIGVAIGARMVNHQ